MLLLYFFLIFSSLLTIFFLKKFNYISKKFKLLDSKNLHYSNKATPTGSGIIFLIIFLFGNILLFTTNNFEHLIPNRYYLLIISAIILSLISFRDDIKTIDPILRLIIQFACIYIAMTNLNLNTFELPFKLVIALIFFLWVYNINITNFIDGTDGFLITHTIFCFVNILLLHLTSEQNFFSQFIAMILLPASIIFLYFNKPIAQVYMGDAGSIFLGFLLGYSFLELLSYGYWNISLSLIAYPLVDCSICLLKKLKKGIMPWVGMYDYYFLKPALHNKSNHKIILLYFVFFNFLNLIIIQIQYILNEKLLSSLSILLSLLLIYIYKNFKKFKFFHVQKSNTNLI